MIASNASPADAAPAVGPAALAPTAASPPDAPLPCLCLAGPTASGKTAAALAIAERLARTCPVEIVSVDSALVYCGMDIGTAKPTPGQRARVRHHLVDIIEPNEVYSAARFVADAQRLVGEIRARGALPLLVGGTMLYFKALFEGLDDMPASDPVVRAQLALQLEAQGLAALHRELTQVDPVTAARLPRGDTQRILRALEVQRVSGLPLSSFHRRPQPRALPPLISIEPRERAWLHNRIALRFREMLACGLLDEVRRLMRRGDLRADMPAMRCVGYRQAWELLGGDKASELNAPKTRPPDPSELAALAERGIAATRQLAKRQVTWLRSMPQRHVVAADADDALERAVELAESLMTRPSMQATAAAPKPGTAASASASTS